MFQPSVKNVNTLPNQNTKFDKRSVSKQEHKHTQCMIMILIQHPQKRFICSSRCLLFILITNDHPQKKNMYIKKCNLEKLRQAVPNSGTKLWNEITGRMRDVKKVCKQKLISALFKKLKKKDD